MESRKAQSRHKERSVPPVPSAGWRRHAQCWNGWSGSRRSSAAAPTAPELLDELRELVREAEAWARIEGDERAAEAVERCGDALSARILPV